MTLKGIQAARPVSGYYQMTSLGTALPIPGTGAIVMLQAEAQNVRYRADGIDPTATVGMLLRAGECHTLNMGSGSLQDIKVIEVATGGILNITAFK